MDSVFEKEHQQLIRKVKTNQSNESIAKAFQDLIYHYYDHYKRSFPWRETRDPYNVYISEVMLQQTQAPRVVEKYNAWIRKFPNFKTLADASFADVLSEWKGLGYNRRAKYVYQTAQKIQSEYNGTLPSTIEELEKLTGIGPNTARSIAAFAFNKPVVFIETNIRAVYIHIFFADKRDVSDADLMPLIEKTADQNNSKEWYNALMDYGVMLKKKHKNPSRKSKHYTKQKQFKGSNREVRGKILEILLKKNGLEKDAIITLINDSPEKVVLNIDNLKKEGLIQEVQKKYYIAQK